MGGIVDLFAFSNIIDVWIELWCDFKRFLNKAFTRSIFNWGENNCSLSLMITDIHFYYNNKCKHSTNKMTPREVLFNYN